MRKPSNFTYEWYDYDALNAYAGLDCVATLELMASLMPKLLEKPRYTWYQQGQRTVSTAPSVFSEQLNIKTKALEFICDMEIVGMQYDIEGNRAMDRRMVEDLAATEDQIFTAIGKRIDLSSAAVLKDFLYREKGFEAPLQTKHGDDSTSGDALIALNKIHQLPWLEAIKKRNDVMAMHGNFIKTYIEDWVKSDGRVHPSYNLHGTSSHRISSSEPNLLNLPRGYYGYNIRQLYTAKPGYIFLAFDFSSCEVKILAALSGDETMIEACVSGKDFHSYTASMIYHIDYDEFVAIVKDHHHPDHKKFKNYRQGAKSVTFGLLYGATVNSIARDLGIELSEAQEIVDAYFNIYPRVKAFIADCHAMAGDNQFVVTPFGQRKMEFGTLPMFRGSAAFNAAKRNAQNVMIQSPASTLGLVVFTELNRRMKEIGGQCICTVYDSIEIEVPLAKAEEAVKLGYYVMNDWPQEVFDWLNFPIGADGEIGWNWGDVEPVYANTTQAEIMTMLAAANSDKFQEALRIAA